MSARNGPGDCSRAPRSRDIFSLMYGILTLISIGFYPANMSWDSVKYWCGVLEEGLIRDNMPIALILFQRLLSYIVQNCLIFIFSFNVSLSHLL